MKEKNKMNETQENNEINLEDTGFFAPSLSQKQTAFVRRKASLLQEALKNIPKNTHAYINIVWCIFQGHSLGKTPLKMVEGYTHPHKDNGEPIELTAHILPDKGHPEIIILKGNVIYDILGTGWKFESIKFLEGQQQVTFEIEIPLTLRQRLFRIKRAIKIRYYKRGDKKYREKRMEERKTEMGV